MFRLMLLAATVAALLAVQPVSAATPHRIISLSPTATESLFAIGAGKQVVAVDDQSDYPKRAPRTTLSGYTPNVEAIAGYRPDLVVLSGNPNDVVSGLRKLGIRVLVQSAAKNLAEAYAEIRQLGVITGHRKSADALAVRMKKAITKAVASAPKRRLSVYHELDPTYYSATSSTFIGSIYKLFGFRDIADAAGGTGGGYPQLSGEYIVAKNPQIIVLADTRCCGQSLGSVSSRPGWGTISAVQHHRVFGANDDVASRWGPRIVQFARSVARIAKQD